MGMISEELDTDQKDYTQRLKRIVYEFYGSTVKHGDF